MVRFVHTADWQLGMTRHFLDADAQARFSEARIEAVRKIGKLAADNDCPFVVVSGDVFETNHVERQVIVKALEAMAATPEIAFYLLPGNHDPLSASSVYRSTTFLRHHPDNVTVLEEEGVLDVGNAVRLVAAPWTTRSPLKDLIHRAIAKVPPSDGITVVVGHGIVDALSPDTTDPALISLALLTDAIRNGQIQYVALGDRHSTTQVENSERIWYSGAPEPTAFREIGPGNALVVEVDRDDINVALHQIGEWSFHTIEFNLLRPDDIDRLNAALSQIENKSVSIVRLVLVGQVSLAEKARLDAMLDHFSDLFASLNTWERHSDLVVLPNDEDFTSLGLSGFARAAFDELVGLAQGEGDLATSAVDALGLLYRLAGVAH